MSENPFEYFFSGTFPFKGENQDAIIHRINEITEEINSLKEQTERNKKLLMGLVDMCLESYGDKNGKQGKVGKSPDWDRSTRGLQDTSRPPKGAKARTAKGPLGPMGNKKQKKGDKP